MPKKYTKEQILEQLRNNEDDYWCLPQYGLIADWYLRYWYLHIAVMQLLEIQDEYEGPWPLRDKGYKTAPRGVMPAKEWWK